MLNKCVEIPEGESIDTWQVPEWAYFERAKNLRKKKVQQSRVVRLHLSISPLAQQWASCSMKTAMELKLEEANTPSLGHAVEALIIECEELLQGLVMSKAAEANGDYFGRRWITKEAKVTALWKRNGHKL